MSLLLRAFWDWLLSAKRRKVGRRREDEAEQGRRDALNRLRESKQKVQQALDRDKGYVEEIKRAMDDISRSLGDKKH